MLFYLSFFYSVAGGVCLDLGAIVFALGTG